MSNVVDPKQFWEKKIIEWENGRYGVIDRKYSLLERLANRASDSLRFRMAITGELLKPSVKGKHIVELGCGSGLLAEKFVADGAASYTGYDISENAISNARTRAVSNGFSDQAKFEVCAVEGLPALSADIVFSLGLFDWLEDSEISNIFKVSGNAEFLHAISEKRSTPSQYLHRLYVYLAYGWRTGSYVPKYHTVDEIEALAKPYGCGSVCVYRNEKLSFTSLISSLPIVG